MNFQHSNLRIIVEKCEILGFEFLLKKKIFIFIKTYKSITYE